MRTEIPHERLEAETAKEAPGSRTTERHRVLVIGLDGATFDVLTPLLEAGFMPTLQGLMTEGVSGPLASVLPSNSAAAWSSFATGKLPSRHGIFEFRHRPDGSLNPTGIVNSTLLREETMWQMIGRHGLRSGVIGMPMTYPPYPLKGFMVTGLLTPKNATTFTYPGELSDRLREMHNGEYMFDVEWMEYQGREEQLIADLDNLTNLNLETTLNLAGNGDWDFLVTVFVSPDRLQHCFWPYIDPGFPKYDPVEAETLYPLAQQHFAHLDSCIGQLVSGLVDDRTMVLVMSDHGFRGVYQQMVLDDWLAEQGLLRYRTARRNLLQNLKRIAQPIYHRFASALNGVRRLGGLYQTGVIDWTRTKAYCPLDQQQAISINLKGRQPQGIVSPGAEYEQLMSELENLMQEARHPETGHPLFNEVIRGKEYYGDSTKASTPDLVVLPGNYLRVAAPRQRRMYDSTGWATGDHAVSGILIARGNGVRQNRTVNDARLVDLAPTILYTLDVPIPDNMDGRLLRHIFEPNYLESRPPATEGSRVGQRSPLDAQLCEKDEQELTERLRGLGYL
jgi:predicted AlkP superfamily phosphohydrolase/phosphomutase